MTHKKTVATIVLNNFTNDSRVLKEARSLQNNGYEVIVVALYEKPLAEHEKIENFHVHRIRLKTRSWPKIKPIQVIKYFEFIWKALKHYKKADIIHCNDLNALPIGVIIKKFFNKNAKIVYDAHEYETETNGLSSLQKILNRHLESMLIKYADQVITVSDSIANEYVRLYGINKPALVLNCPPHESVSKQNKFRESLGIREDQRIFLYQGGLMKGRGCEMLINIFSGFDTDKNIIVFMGYGPLESYIKKHSINSSNIFFHDAVSPNILHGYTSSADYGISLIEDISLSDRYSLPNKLFEYTMAGLPVIVSNLFEMKRLVETEGIGIVAHENTVNGFMQAFLASLQQDYASIQKNVFEARKKYCWEVQEKVLKVIYDAL